MGGKSGKGLREAKLAGHPEHVGSRGEGSHSGEAWGDRELWGTERAEANICQESFLMGYVRLTPLGRCWVRGFSHLLESLLCP